MIFTIFDCLNVHLQKGKKLQSHYNWFLINYGRLINQRAWVYKLVPRIEQNIFQKYSRWLYHFAEYFNDMTYDLQDTFKNVL